MKKLFYFIIILIISFSSTLQNAKETLIYADSITYDQDDNLIAKGNVKIISTRHYAKASKDSRLINKFEFFLLKNDLKIICISNYVKNYLIEKGIPDKKLSVIYNGIDLNLYNNLNKNWKCLLLEQDPTIQLWFYLVYVDIVVNGNYNYTTHPQNDKEKPKICQIPPGILFEVNTKITKRFEPVWFLIDSENELALFQQGVCFYKLKYQEQAQLNFSKLL